MVNVFGKTLLGVVASLVAAGFASAQLEKAQQLLRTNQRDAALEALREILAADPSDTDAFDLWRNAERETFELFLAEGGDFAKIARDLLSRARVGRGDLSSDAAEIGSLVQAALADDYETRSAAQVKLASNHGEFAVPALLNTLANADSGEGQDRAMACLVYIGRPAVLALVEALKAADETLRRNVAATLVHLGDRRSAPAFALLYDGDPSDAVRHVAKRGLERLGVKPGTSAAGLYLEAASDYLSGTGVGSGDYSSVIWSIDGNKIVPSTVPAPLYHLELAKRRAFEAMVADPTSGVARALVARCYLAESAAIKDYVLGNPDAEGMAELISAVPQLNLVALGTGRKVLRQALRDSLEAGQTAVTVEIIGALASAEERDSLGSSPLVAALDNSDSRIRYAAAVALTNASGGVQVPAASRVVAALSDAVREESLRFIKVVDGSPQTANVVAAAHRTRGFAVDASATGGKAVSDIYRFPNYDVVIVNETLSDHTSEHVISLIRKRSPNAKILLLAQGEDGGGALAESVDGVIAGPLDRETLIEKATEALGDLEPRRGRADAIAVKAAAALRSLANGGTDVSSAVSSLTAQLDRSDEIAIPAAAAIGRCGSAGSLDGLLAVVRGEGSLELKVAAATAIGGVVSRSAELSVAHFDALLAVSANGEVDTSLRTAVVTALGKAALDPGSVIKLTQTLGSIASTGGDGL